MPTTVQDAVIVAPHVYKVLFENDRVRLLEVRLKPGDSSAMHSHPAYAIYPLNDAKPKFTSSDGKSEEVELKAGEAIWHEAESHAVENRGTTEAHVILFELK
jgi:quercetin dioxygenase-like cupin family protein